ncbi:hypothetical protein AMTR_s00114p00035740 [Amborella trichopoda]|uniref:Uncharacterized protein n=1 Tax=Amborella trichopoda TaxID=13333 RepID=W1NPU4_AMBTC|nr:hypothetical protein AMTR_s00114p00035740 [Amborella trichopoda]
MMGRLLPQFGHQLLKISASCQLATKPITIPATAVAKFCKISAGVSPTKARTPAASATSLDPTSALVFPTSSNHPISCLNTASKAIALIRLISFPPATANKPLFSGVVFSTSALVFTRMVFSMDFCGCRWFGVLRTFETGFSCSGLRLKSKQKYNGFGSGCFKQGRFGSNKE